MSIDPGLVAAVEQLPTEPGVYLFKDRKGVVLYVGKAKSLRSRARQYMAGTDERPMVPFLVRQATTIEVMVVRTEKEALILENTLIKKHRPRYNTRLVDDSTFLHLRIDPQARWPRYELLRGIQPASKVRFFGPFASASRARATLEFIHRRFPLRTCTDRELEGRKRPCLLHQMGRCVAPCVGLSTREDYADVVEQSLLFLEGRHPELMDRLRARMMGAAEREAFEEAARVRDLIRAIEASTERQQVVDPRLGDRDVWGIHRAGDRGVVCILPVRRGVMQELVTLPFDDQVVESGELLSSMLNAWYPEGGEIPVELLLAEAPPDLAALTEVLSERRGAGLSIRVPQRGEKVHLVELANQNAAGAFQRRESEEERRERTLGELMRVCRLPMMPRRIECYDNSNIQGTDPVASRVVFLNGEPNRALYRRYRVKTVVGADDFATMREILRRRLLRGLAEEDLPDLLVVDGGKGQVSAALAILDELGFVDHRRAGAVGTEGRRMIGLIGLVKPRTEARRGDREATDKIVLPGVQNPLRLPANSPALRLLQHLRDEAHDTAVQYHRKVRGRRALTSELDALEGVGETRRRALLTHFGSVRALRLASPSDIALLPGFGAKLAARIFTALHAADPAPDAGLTREGAGEVPAATPTTWDGEE